jgi:hypothetical protein
VAGLLLVCGLIAVPLLTAGPAQTTVPELLKLPRGGVTARARRFHLMPAFSNRHSATKAGIAIAQTPAQETRVAQGSKVRVVLSAGPPPVAVAGVVGESAASAESTLANSGLRYALHPVAAPASAPGLVVRQSPDTPATVARGSTVALWVSEPPRWRPLTTFSGIDDGRSVPFRILGRRWRVIYSMGYRETCVFLVVCDGPSAEAVEPHATTGAGSFELNDGTGSEHVFDSGPGLFQLAVSGGRDSARWRMTVEDYY